MNPELADEYDYENREIKGWTDQADSDPFESGNGAGRTTA